MRVTSRAAAGAAGDIGHVRAPVVEDQVEAGGGGQPRVSLRPLVQRTEILVVDGVQQRLGQHDQIRRGEVAS
jgi:hypothetical protein